MSTGEERRIAGDLLRPRPNASRMVLRAWKPVRKGALIGFAAISLPSGLEIDDVPVLISGGRAWAALPARPVITNDGRVAKLPGTSVALVREHHPEAFVEEGGA
jgi:hypothetical protein